MVEVLKAVGEKTFKREVGAALLVLWGLITLRLFFTIKAEEIVMYQGVYGVVSTSVFLFAMAAFGLDHFKKLNK